MDTWIIACFSYCCVLNKYKMTALLLVSMSRLVNGLYKHWNLTLINTLTLLTFEMNWSTERIW